MSNCDIYRNHSNLPDVPNWDYQEDLNSYLKGSKVMGIYSPNDKISLTMGQIEEAIRIAFSEFSPDVSDEDEWPISEIMDKIQLQQLRCNPKNV
jgi:hypothetical protein